MSKLENKRAIYNVIGAMCKDITLFRNEKYNLNPEDFPMKAQQIIFLAMYELSCDNPDMKSINEIDVDNYLSGYPSHYEIYQKNDGINYVRNAIENCNIDLFDKYYNELKKFSLLRTYEDNGFDIKKIYDYNEQNLEKKSEQFKALMKMSEEDIVKEVTMSILEVKEKWNFSNSSEKTGYHASENIDENMNKLLEEGEIGLSYSSPYLNSLFLGASRGKFLLRSANTGNGKSRLFVADACEFSCSHKWIKDKWVEIRQNSPTLYICTELELEEIQLLMIAYISGVGTRDIKKGNLNKVDQAKIERAKEIIKEAPLYVEVLEDGDITDLQMLIETYILRHGVVNVIYDYIENSPKMCKSIGKMYGISNVREDQVLQNFTNAFKKLAVRFNVFIQSGTQLNREYTYDENNLAGGKGTARKVDSGIIVGYVSPEEMDKIKGFCEETGKTPNYATHVYKNRGGGQSGIIIFSHMNLGNMREEFVFATDYNYQWVDISPMEIKPVVKVEEKIKENPYDF